MEKKDSVIALHGKPYVPPCAEYYKLVFEDLLNKSPEEDEVIPYADTYDAEGAKEQF